MRCYACNDLLSDYEATRRCAFTHTFLDLCNNCYSTIDVEIKTTDRPELKHQEDGWHDSCELKRTKED